MYDPISIFFCMWALNIDMPPARLNVAEIVSINKERIVVER
jgi:hypothetical protein